MGTPSFETNYGLQKLLAKMQPNFSAITFDCSSASLHSFFLRIQTQVALPCKIKFNLNLAKTFS